MYSSERIGEVHRFQERLLDLQAQARIISIDQINPFLTVYWNYSSGFSPKPSICQKLVCFPSGNLASIRISFSCSN